MRLGADGLLDATGLHSGVIYIDQCHPIDAIASGA